MCDSDWLSGSHFPAGRHQEPFIQSIQTLSSSLSSLYVFFRESKRILLH